MPRNVEAQIYRTYLLWGRSIPVVIVPAILFLGDIGESYNPSTTLRADILMALSDWVLDRVDLREGSDSKLHRRTRHHARSVLLYHYCCTKPDVLR